MKVAMICTGNICRSPIGEVVLAHAVSRDPSLASRVVVTSAGTARWHVGEAMDHRAASALRRAGYEADASLGMWATAEYLSDLDLAIAMTREHRHDLLERRPDLDVLLLREVLGQGTLDLADPYFGNDDDFDACVRALEEAVPLLLEEIRRRLDS